MEEVPEEKSEIIVYQLNDESAEFEELDFDEDIQLYELLDPAFILLFLDPDHYKAYIWQGSETSTRMKFISAKLATSVRDRHGAAMKIVTADDGNEPFNFKVMVGLEEPIDVEEQQTGPSYTGTEEAKELFNLATREQILLTMEKAKLPHGYKRVLIIVGNKVYKYHIQNTEYMGSMVEERKLLPLEEEVPDGPYLAEGYIPRMLFSFNKVVLMELLKKMTQEEIEEREAMVREREEFNRKQKEKREAEERAREEAKKQEEEQEKQAQQQVAVE